MKFICLLLLQLCNATANTLAQNHHKSTYAHSQTINHPISPSSKLDKPIIDSIAIKRWISLGNNYDLAISNDGQYFAYFTLYPATGKKTLIVQSASNAWKKEFPDASPGQFSKDSKQYFFRLKDTLYFLLLGTQHSKYISGVADYGQPDAAKGEWLAWQLTNNPGQLVLHDLLTGKEQYYNSVTSFTFGRAGKGLLLKTVSIKDTLPVTTLQLVTLPEKTAKTIWSTEGNQNNLISFTIDNSGSQVVFMTQQTASPSFVRKKEDLENTIWYYKIGMKTAIQKADNRSVGIPSGLQIQEAPSFSDDGRYIFFGLQPQQRQPKPSPIKLDIWHYGDTTLQSTQLKQQESQTYAAVISTENNRVIRLQQDYELSLLPPKGDFMVFAKNTQGDRFWINQQDSNWLVSLRDGNRTLLQTVGRCDFWFSPNGKYLIYSDVGQQSNYFSYNLKTGKTINISTTIPARSLSWHNEFEPQPQTTVQISLTYPVGVAGWLQGDTALLIYDNYDIWKLDPTGRYLPENITAGYGQSHHIKFRLAEDQGQEIVINSKKALLLSAYNTKNMYNGFYKKKLNKPGNPILLTMGPYVFTLLGRQLYTPNGHDYDQGMVPTKANNSNIWIVKRQNNTEAPNYFSTRDFINYKMLTHLQPHDSYNWLTAELMRFNQVDGKDSQGILYKPENFDPTKKYPVLINYYEQLSHRLYQFPKADFTRHNINVAWFVSRGYLVFTPDIHSNRARRGESAFNAVVGAAQHLSKLSFVDASKIGINGHSVGGGLTNYIITHTNMFAAAIEGAGVSDQISSALQLSNGISRLNTYDIYKGSLWQNIDQWLADSPIMNVDKITTPLLIFHNKKDEAVPWEQALELFIAMRRLSKRVWILQYDDGRHGVWGKNCEDYTIRITQFFDHYLKGTPPPVWMTKGIPARLKGVDDGLELDTQQTTPTVHLPAPFAGMHK